MKNRTTIMTEAIPNQGEDFTIETIKNLASFKYEHPLETLSNYKQTWFEKIMNKLGWYRQTTIYVIRSDKIKL